MVLSSILVVMLLLTNVANAKSAVIITVLGGETYKIVKGDTEENTEYFTRNYTTQETLKAYMDQICQTVEEEGIVLIKNDKIEGGENALPMAKNSKISLFGQGSARFNYSTTGSSATTSTSAFPTLREALKDFDVNNTLWDFYTSGPGASYKRNKANLVYKVNEAPWSAYTDGVKNSFASYGDAAIYVISRDSGEGMDITTTGSDGLDGSYLSITAQEQEVLRELTSLRNSGTFDRIIVLLNSSQQIQLDFMFDDSITVDACLWVGNVGSTGIYAINDILTGAVVPSGRLSDTYLKDNFSSPAMKTWALNPDKNFTQVYSNASSYPQLGSGTHDVYAVYVEGIYVGYRYYETRYYDKVAGAANVGDYNYDNDVAYPFGHGLSYSEFYYSDFNVVEDDEKFTVSVDVLNIGAYDAKEVVQVYLSKPYTQYDKNNKVEKAAVELAGFKKVALRSGQNKVVTIEIEKSQLRSYDSYGKGTYILESGDYYLTVASDSHDAAKNILVSKGYNVEGKTAAQVNAKTYKKTINVTGAGGVDDQTFAKSSANEDVAIVNQFDYADINRYSGKGSNSVTYVSRNNWVGTYPTSAISLSVTPQMVEDLKSYKEFVEDGSTMPKYSQQNGLTMAMLKGEDYDNPAWQDLLDQMTYAEQAYLITNGQHNTIAIQSVSKPATRDENGPNGVDKSVTGTAFPSEGVWASTFNYDLIQRVGDALAEDALATGITGLYAPGVNLHRTPFGGRNHEYFSEDPYLMGMCSVAEVIGMQKKGVIAYVKHFVANDEETNRNGVAIWVNEQEMREIILLPFEYSFDPSKGNAHATMTSFNRLGCLWTSATSNLMEKVLRDEWGFDGFAITDMASGNAQSFMTFPDGIANGTNLYDGSGSETALDDYKNSPMFANKMRESAHKIMYITVNYSAAMNGISSADRIVTILTWWQVLLLVIDIAIGVLTAASVVLLGFSYYKKLKA